MSSAILALKIDYKLGFRKLRAVSHDLFMNYEGSLAFKSGIGLSLYLACLGLDAGAHFFETVMRPEGAAWIGIGFAITLVPVIIMALVAMRISHLDFGSTCGMLCGSMANPMALNYANETLPGDNPAVSYATVYPLSMFSRVVIAQLILMFFI